MKAASIELTGALSVAETAFGAGSIEAAEVLNLLGMVNKYSGHFDDAESLYRRCLEIMLQTVGEEHPSVASIYHNLGGLLHAAGDFAAAEAPARHAFEIRARTLGADHPTTVLDRAAWASILDGLGRSGQAEQ